MYRRVLKNGDFITLSEILFFEKENGGFDCLNRRLANHILFEHNNAAAETTVFFISVGRLINIS
ncbi:MAG TPA: hypothetical protein DDZ65_11055 [Firmicutes bacterium]|nr:hypothetical protein [Bacillota bacterium]